MKKAFKFRLYTTINQSNQLNQHNGSCRFVYNWALDQEVKTYEQIGKLIYRFDLNKLIPNLKKQNPWLEKVNSQSLLGMTKQAESKFTRFFREKKWFPKFKSKKNQIKLFSKPQHYNVDFEINTVKFPKIGEIEVVLHKTVEGELKTATFPKSCTGKYYISILGEAGKEVPVKQAFFESTTIGVVLYQN